MTTTKNDKERPKPGKSLLEITLEISNLHDREHAYDAIPGSGRDVIID